MTTVNCLFTNIFQNILFSCLIKFWENVKESKWRHIVFYFGLNYPLYIQLNNGPNINLPQNTSSHLEGAI